VDVSTLSFVSLQASYCAVLGSHSPRVFGHGRRICSFHLWTVSSCTLQLVARRIVVTRAVRGCCVLLHELESIQLVRLYPPLLLNEWRGICRCPVQDCEKERPESEHVGSERLVFKKNDRKEEEDGSDSPEP
jgi:hypothetical protein